MHSLSFTFGLVSLFLQSSSAAPTSNSQGVAIQQRDIVGSILSGIDSVANDVTDDVTGTISQLLDDLKAVRPTATPTNVEYCSASISSVWQTSPTPTNLYAALTQQIAAGLTADNAETIINFAENAVGGENSFDNVNTREPSKPIYPQASPEDSPYDISEASLRAAIYIPETFQYGADGAPNPIVLVPGTGDTGYTTFVGNLIPLLQGSSIADPVWLNIPGFLLNDAQDNAEYVAYAINYIKGISNNRNISVAAWSQGNIDTQWAYKYWPSTRVNVSDHIGFSPDYHGTVLANFVAFPGEPLPPSLLQQEYDSNFISTLRRYGGDSAYVPTTTIYSGFFDEIVEPQQGTGASGYINDARGLGASNNEVQKVCAGHIAGTFYTHEGTLYNPLGFALLVDALSHDGPGQPSRLNLASVCSTYLTPGLDVADFLLTENSILIAGITILTYPNSTNVEPPIKSYAEY